MAIFCLTVSGNFFFFFFFKNLTKRIRVSQVIINLLSNAFKFTEKGKVVVELEYHPTTTPPTKKEEKEKKEEKIGDGWGKGSWGDGWGEWVEKGAFVEEGGEEGGAEGEEGWERDNGGIMSVRVTDTGIGISSEKKAQLFQVFFFLS